MNWLYQKKKHSALPGLLLLFCQGFTSAAELTGLTACLQQDKTILTASVSIETTTAKGKTHHEMHRLLRKEAGFMLDSDKGNLRLHAESGHPAELARSPDGAWQRVTEKDQSSRAWLTDFTLLIPNRTPLTNYRIKSDMNMAGKRYLTLVADSLDPVATGGFGQISLSVTLKDGNCSLLRAVYFDAAGKVWKKVFYHWQSIEGHTLWKNMHVENTHTLERTVYRFSEYQLKPE